MTGITKADCKHCEAIIYLSSGSVLWLDYAIAEGLNGGYCYAAERHDHEPAPGSMR